MRSRLLPMLMLLGLFALPSAAVGLESGSPYFPTYTGDQFQALYDYAVEHSLGNLVSNPEQGVITGNPELDERIWELAFDRGYRLRPVASDGLVSADGVLMQPEAADAWAQLKAEARANGYSFIVSSAYRSVATQRSWFNSKLGGTSDAAISATLVWYSVPGTSKHHGGYALDFRHASGTFGEFRSTPDYRWLAADNFHVPKKYGFIPSYPDDVEEQGPNPEPWEFVWVGVDLIRCGVPLDIGELRHVAGHRWWLEDEMARCPGGVSLDELDQMLRTLGPKLEAMLRA